MRTPFVFIWPLFLLFALNSYATEDFNITLCQHEAWDRTNVWITSASKLEKQTPWQPDIAEPPLTVGRAVSLAKTWVISKGSDTNAYVETITIKPIDSSGSKNKFYSIWFYKIQFGGVGIYGHHMTCIVLMDGTIAEMEHLGVPSRKRSYLDYLD